MLVDNGASWTIWNRKRDLKNYRMLTKEEVHIIGLSSTKIPKGIGKINLRLINDKGKEHKFEVLEAYYYPNEPICLFSPQAWAQQRRTYHGDTIAHYDTQYNGLVLEWSNDGGLTILQKTIPYSSANVGITTANISNRSFDTYTKLFSCFANVVSDDEG